jgi:transglutaminase-like putative cysteine protease
MRLTPLASLGFVFATLVGSGNVSARGVEDKVGAPRERKFQLEYSVSISGLKPGEKVQVWLPIPPSSEDQSVEVLPGKFPVTPQTNTETLYGNKMSHFEMPAPDSGSVESKLAFQIKRKEVRGLPGERSSQPMTLSEAERKLHLAPNKKIPLTGRPLQLLEGTSLPKNSLALARVFYDRVDEHVKYDKSRPGYGQGDVNWVCDSRFGNCTDFHSLFISWARSHKLPARFEIGFPLPDQRGKGEIPGYHCWAYFYIDGHGWTPVDISEADKNPAMKEYYFGHLTENRVTFTSGRDLNLVPKQAGEPLNFFVYPYVEVAGKPLPKEQVKLTVTYKDE